jgi:predicted small secreted protein
MKRILISAVVASSILTASAAIAMAVEPNTGHGAEVSAVAKAVENVIEGSHGKYVSQIAKAHGAAVSADARANGAAHAAAQGDNGADASESGRLKAEAGAANQP